MVPQWAALQSCRVAGRAIPVLLVAAGAIALSAQRFDGGGRRRGNAVGAGATEFSRDNVRYDGRFTYTRLRYTPSFTSYGGGGGWFGGVNYSWDHDYPRSDRTFPTILAELTHLAIRRDSSNILAFDDPELLKFPFAYLSEAGMMVPTDAEIAGLRDYLLKGGFVIADDFAGPGAWLNFERHLRRMLPDARPIRLTAAHPIFHSFFDIDSLDFMHPFFGVRSEFYGVFEDNDPSHRMMMIVNFNADISESWEWSGTGFIPIDLTNEMFKLGVNYVVYAMTH
jgi:hypothetical protein